MVNSSILDDIPKIVVDQNATTHKELEAKWPLGPATLDKFITKKCNNGEWERVRKKVDGKHRIAYRKKQK